MLADCPGLGLHHAPSAVGCLLNQFSVASWLQENVNYIRAGTQFLSQVQSRLIYQFFDNPFHSVMSLAFQYNL